MGLGAALFGIALLVTATAVIPIAIAAMVQHQTPSVLWLRRHVRWIWATSAFLWLASLVLEFFHRSPLSGLDFITSAAGFVVAVGAALLVRPPGEHANPPA